MMGSILRLHAMIIEIPQNVYKTCEAFSGMRILMPLGELHYWL